MNISIRCRNDRRGAVMLAVVAATFATVSVLAVMMTLAKVSSERANTERHAAEARHLASGALEAAKRELGIAIANWQPAPAGGEVDIAGTELTYEVLPTDPIPIQTDAAGIQTLVQAFELFSIGESHRARQPVRRLVNVEATPLFQFAVFYNGDLEILPGPNMTIDGRVHTNGNMYLSCGNTLSFNTNYVRAVGKILRHRKDAPGTSAGSVEIRRWVENPFSSTVPAEYVPMYNQSQMAAQGVATTSGYDSNFTAGLDANGDGSFFGAGDWPPWAPGALHFWGATPVPPGGDPPALSSDTFTVKDQAHGTQNLLVPSMASTSMFEPVLDGDHVWNSASGTYVPSAPGEGTHAKGFFHQEADLSLVVMADGTWDAFNGIGVSVKGQLESAVSVGTIYDARQAQGSGQETPVVKVDMELLNASGVFPANGLFYASHYGLGTGVDAKGIQLVNGAELAGNLTVVSEGGLYIQGDYNTQNKKSSAVIADAVNLLSNAWTGTKSPGNLPAAANTTFNTAIVSGNGDTSVGNYNGGFENLPRFHENWSGRQCNISGSFVNLANSQFATGPWLHGSDYYQAPGRNWSYDPLFNDASALPPFTPMAVQVREIASW